MKKGWQKKTLGELCDILDSQRKPITKRDRTAGKFPYYGATGIVDYVNDFIFDEPLVLVGEDGAKWESGENTAFRIEGKCWVNNHAHVLRPRRNELLDNWIIYFLNHSDLTEFVSGLTVPKLNQGSLRGIPIPLPPRDEQRRILEILDEVFSGIATATANAQKNLQNARALFASHLQSVLLGKKWKWKTIGDLTHNVEYGSSAKSKKEGKIPVLRMGNIQDGKFDWKNLVYTDDDEEIERYQLKHNDVLFNRTNSPELVGKTAIYKSEMPAIFAGYLIRINRKEDLLDADYLNYFLNSDVAFDYGKTVVISSVNQANINGAKLKNYPIPAPTLAEQQQNVATLDSLREETQRLEKIYHQKLAALVALKKSLLQQAFAGELTKDSVQLAVVQRPLWPPLSSLQSITPINLHAGILAIGYQAYEQAGRRWRFQHVVAEKFSHMTEALVGIDLGRNPVKDHNGPNDFPHLQKVEHRARKANYFTFQDGQKGKIFVKRPGFDFLVDKTRAALGELNQKLDSVIQLMVKMDMQQAEIFATVYAAWNNLLMDGLTPTDEQIVSAARENWHPDKLKILRERFFGAIDWIREKNICPEGKGKRVTAKAA